MRPCPPLIYIYTHTPHIHIYIHIYLSIYLSIIHLISIKRFTSPVSAAPWVVRAAASAALWAEPAVPSLVAAAAPWVAAWE